MLLRLKMAFLYFPRKTGYHAQFGGATPQSCRGAQIRVSLTAPREPPPAL
jgi:hypothetical protein